MSFSARLTRIRWSRSSFGMYAYSSSLFDHVSINGILKLISLLFGFQDARSLSNSSGPNNSLCASESGQFEDGQSQASTHSRARVSFLSTLVNLGKTSKLTWTCFRIDAPFYLSSASRWWSTKQNSTPIETKSSHLKSMFLVLSDNGLWTVFSSMIIYILAGKGANF